MRPARKSRPFFLCSAQRLYYIRQFTAIESIGEPGSITIIGARDGRTSSLSFTDTGPGLSKNVQEQLFTPFYTTRENGQGIGLTMVQEILLAHGFDFTLENGERVGARFLMTF